MGNRIFVDPQEEEKYLKLRSRLSSVYLPIGMMERLQDEAAKLLISQSQFIRLAVSYCLDNIDVMEEAKGYEALARKNAVQDKREIRRQQDRESVKILNASRKMSVMPIKLRQQSSGEYLDRLQFLIDSDALEGSGLVGARRLLFEAGRGVDGLGGAEIPGAEGFTGTGEIVAPAAPGDVESGEKQGMRAMADMAIFLERGGVASLDCLSQRPGESETDYLVRLEDLQLDPLVSAAEKARAWDIVIAIDTAAGRRK